MQLLYFSFFGRLPSQTETALQVNEALNRGVSRTALTTGFLNSTEFNTGGRFIAGLYAGILDRDAEFSGWLFQRNALSMGSVNPTSLIGNFMGSQEYALKFGNPSNEDFVRLLYRYVLLREAALAEVQFHAGFLASGSTRVQLATNFLNSQEFRGCSGPRLTAFLLHACLLLRDATAPEFALRSEQIRAGRPVIDIITEILASQEFLGLIN